MKLIDSPRRVKFTREARRYSSHSRSNAPVEVPIMGDARDKGKPTAIEPFANRDARSFFRSCTRTHPVHCCTASWQRRH